MEEQVRMVTPGDAVAFGAALSALGRVAMQYDKTAAKELVEIIEKTYTHTLLNLEASRRANVLGLTDALIYRSGLDRVQELASYMTAHGVPSGETVLGEMTRIVKHTRDAAREARGE